MTVVWCLSGGGIKGAFQVGATLAIQRLNPALAPDRIAATSVGAVNALALSSRDLRSACGIMLDEYLQLQTRTSMYDLSPRFRELLGTELFSRARLSSREMFDLADLDPAGLFRRLQGSAVSEATGIVRDAAIGGAIGLILGLPGALLGAWIAADESYEETKADFDASLNALGRIRALYTLAPIATRLRRRLAEFDLRETRPVRFESVALEDGRTYAIDEKGNLRVGLANTRAASEAVPVLGNTESVIIRGILASAAIPMAFHPIVINVADGHDLTLVDGGVRNVLPVLSTLDLLHDAPDAKLVVIANSENLSKFGRTFGRWPHFSERSGSEFDYRPNGDPDAEMLLFKSLAKVTLAIRQNDGIDMGRRLLEDAAGSMIVIEPSVSAIETAQVDPGLIRIWMAYGYLRAVDTLRDTDIKARAFRWSSDWITAARRLIWLSEDTGGPVALSMNRCLYLGVRSVLAERVRRVEKAVPPDSTTLLGELPSGLETAPALVDLQLDGTNWLPRDDAFRDGIRFEMAPAPFESIRGIWPRRTEHALIVRAKIESLVTDSEEAGAVRLPLVDPNTGETTEYTADNVQTLVQPSFELAPQTVPTSNFPLWIAGSAMRLSSAKAEVFGVDPFENRLVRTRLVARGGLGTSADRPLTATSMRFRLPEPDRCVGLFDNCAVAFRQDRGLPRVIVVRGESGQFWISQDRASSWMPVGRPVESALSRRDVPNEGHTAVVLDDGSVLIGCQSSSANPIVVRTDGAGRTTHWRTRYVNWPRWPLLGQIERGVVGTRLPCVPTEGGGGSLLHAADGHIWWVPFDSPGTTLAPELVGRERYPFILSGSSSRSRTAVLAGLDGDVLRRLHVTIGNHRDHSIVECHPVSLADAGLRHFGRALAMPPESSDDSIIAIVPVQNAHGHNAWAWVDGCRTIPRIVVSDGLGSVLLPIDPTVGLTGRLK